MEKTKKCKSCGKELPKNAKFCNECGTKFKKPFYTRWWFWVIAVVLFLMIVGAASEGEENPEAVKNQPTESVPVTSTPRPTATPKPTPTPTPSPTPSPTVKPSENKGASLDFLCDLIELAIDESFSESAESGYTITHDGESTITLNVWTDGVVAELVLGGQKSAESWELVKKSMTQMSDSLCGLIDEAGREDVYFVLNVLNDTNHENKLLSILEGVIIYDVMED